MPMVVGKAGLFRTGVPMLHYAHDEIAV